MIHERTVSPQVAVLSFCLKVDFWAHWPILMIVMMGKNIRKIFQVAFILFACVALLSSQSLVEIAKKEKERRAALKAKGITGIVVTNADLKKKIRLPIIVVQPQAASSQDRTQPRQPTTPRPAIRTPSQEEPTESNQNRDVFGYRKNATKVLFYSGPVKNPEYALKKADGQFAEIPVLGVLDLEIEAINGPGADIVIHARLAGAEAVLPGGEEEGGAPDTLSDGWRGSPYYGVLILTQSGEWDVIGQGTGKNSSEKFDLGNYPSQKKIRILFRPFSSNPALFIRNFRNNPGEFTLGIDAVEALH